MTNKTLTIVRKETKRVLIEKREEIKESFRMGLLTVKQYSNLLDRNMKLQNSNF